MSQEIEFDREKLEAALRGGLDLNDLEKGDIDGLLLNVDEEIDEELDDVDATLDMAALGGAYKIGDLDITMVLGNLPLLNAIDSPFMRELNEDDELDFDDCCEAIYVLYHGKEAIEPIMHIQQRIKDLCRLKSVVKNNPELMDKLMDRTEVISQARTKFTEDARDFYLEHFEPNDLQMVVEEMCHILEDAVSAYVPDREETLGQGNKKKLDSVMKRSQVQHFWSHLN